MRDFFVVVGGNKGFAEGKATLNINRGKAKFTDEKNIKIWKNDFKVFESCNYDTKICNSPRGEFIRAGLWIGFCWT